MKHLILSAAIVLGVSTLSVYVNALAADGAVAGKAPSSPDGTWQQSGPAGGVSTANDNHNGPRYDVTKLGAVGDTATDDTAAIQSAFNACWNHGAPITPGGGYGGIVEFPAAKTYIISSTIYTYDSCRLEGMVNSLNPSVVQWNGPAAGVVYKVSSFTVAPNSTPYYPAYSPKPSRIAPYVITFPVTNSVAVNDWVIIQGFSTPAGHSINNTVAQVVAASGASFSVVVPFVPSSTGTTTDEGTVTTINVMFASSTSARYAEEIKDIQFQSKRRIPEANRAGVDFYFGSRVDTGSRVWGTYATAPVYYGYYFSNGGIDIDFDKGWRADNPGIAGVYWRISGQDNFGMANGTVSSNSGGAVVLDNSACNQGFMVRLSSRNMGMEVETQGLAPGLGVFTLLDCPANVFPIQFAIDMENTKTAADKGAVSYPTIVMSPPNDAALSLNIVNGVFPNGISPNTTQRWVGVPGLTRQDASGQQGYIPSLTYAPSFTSEGNLGSSYNSERAMSQCLGDCNIGQLWQYGLQASPFLYTDNSFSGLPNGTTLFAGQIIAPPGYWKGASNHRYVLDVVSQTGTTGTPNGGGTTCKSSGRQWQLVCNSAADLSVGQQVNIGRVTNAMITRIDATSATAVLVSLNKSIDPISAPIPLAFSAPILAPEIQIPTKLQGMPNADAWTRGDMVQNATAASNGIAAWVNVNAGKPGEWAGVPLGNSNGQIGAGQIANTTGTGDVVLAKSPTVNSLTDTGTTSLNNVTISGTCSGCSGRSLRTAQAFCTGAASSSSTLAMSGAGTASAPCTSQAQAGGSAQILMNSSGNLSGFAVRCAHSGANSSSGVFSIWDLPNGTEMSGPASGVNTGLTVTYGATKPNTALFDSIHTFAYGKGDLLRIQFTTQANETLGECEASFNY